MAFKNFKVETDADGIALLTWDIPGRSMNVLDETTINELGEIVKQTTADAAVKGVVVTSGKEAFSAGADLSMLEGMNRRYAELLKAKSEVAANQMLFDESRKSSLVFRAIETCGKPWAAAINGLALGGAFELTLSCHYRVAAENPKIRLGLPEAKVGLFPGAGGTQRVPRIVPPQDAMQLLLKGETVNIEKAKALKLIDAIVPSGDLIKAAKDWIKGGGKAVAPWDDKNFKLPGGPVYSKAGMMMFPAGNAIYRRETYDNYPAQRAIMSCVYEGLQLPIDAALRVESRYFTQVLRSKEAAAMIRSLFLSMQELNKGARRPQHVPPTKVKKLAVIGAGFMGASVGYVSARAGIEVALIDRDQESADKGKGHAKAVIDDLIKKGRAKASDSEAILSRITATADYDVLKDCDLIIEAVFEDRKVKAETYAKAQPLLKGDAIFASNTSTLPINSLAEEFKDQGKFIGIHFFSPVEKMMLVEIIVGKNTGDVALA
ncbi:3-hydroxyacyl-CoA dehydrogenase NAD-binding domain-containing protein, partial [Bradyrhizobium sp.]|uniref:3-hydroxyacyl-CoA dehydrogenase NAD-binding domain-containing protein n=1 Tax=Bradyrhizobium sp. TaxID=376 RepID=UPI003C26E76A